MIGPVFTREMVTGPRRTRFYLFRATYVAVLFLLMCTAYMVFVGSESQLTVGGMARFGSSLFGILAPLQLTVMVFFSALFTASAVAQEKDRRTLELLLLSRLTNRELVLGKLMAAMVNVLGMLLASVPVFCFLSVFGGVSWQQVARSLAVGLASAFLAGSLGSTIALWREKTFQSLAATTLVIVFWLLIGEATYLGALGTTVGGIPATQLATIVSPWRAALEASQPFESAASSSWSNTVVLFLLVSLGLVLLLNAIAIWRVRIWNPHRESRLHAKDARDIESIFDKEHQAQERKRATAHIPATAKQSRQVWDNPVLWREICTQAYGKRNIVIKLAFVALFGAAVALLLQQTGAPGNTGELSLPTLVVAGLTVVALVLVNTQAVTSLTAEKDTRAIDLLLVTDITPLEFIFGKIGGVLYNCKETIVLTLGLSLFLWWNGSISLENTLFLLLIMLTMIIFVSVLGIHAGMAYGSSRSAIAASLGTVFFLFVGIGTCMQIMVAFAGSFQVQLAPFLVFMFGGGIGLFAVIGIRNASAAISLAFLGCPWFTFYALTSFLLGNYVAAFLVTLVTYGFATAAMLVPAIYEFDIVAGRSGGGDDG